MSSGRRRITDPKAVRGMAHPLRLQILELLQERGPMTATQLSDVLGESPANCSFHLRTLGKYGFLVEEPKGQGRSRPWRAVDYDWSMDEENLTGDARRAAPELGAMMLDRAFRRIERWIRERGRYSTQWRKSAFDAQYGISLTRAELAAVGEGIKDLMRPYVERDKAPDDAVRVAVLAWGFPTETTEQRRERRRAR